MKILFVVHHMRAKCYARSEPIARELTRRGHQVTIVCTADKSRSGINEYDEQGIHFVETPDLLPGKLRSGWDVFWNLWHRRRWMRGRHFDIVHAFESRPATIYPVLSYLKRHPTWFFMDWIDWWGRGGLIVDNRPAWYRALFGGMETYYEEHFRILAHGTTVISHGLATRVAGLGVLEETIARVPDGVNLTTFRPQDRLTHRDRFNLPKDRLLLGFSAVDVLHDTVTCLEALQRVRTAGRNVDLVLTGRKTPGFDGQVDQFKLRGHVHHLGFLPYADLPDALSCVDIFLMPFSNRPSNVGRFPHKCCDYMATGRPMVTNPVGDMKLLLEKNDVGLLADETPDAFAAAVLRLVDDAGLRVRLGVNARRTAEEQFAWPKVVDILEAHYRQVMERWRASPGGLRIPIPPST